MLLGRTLRFVLGRVKRLAWHKDRLGPSENPKSLLSVPCKRFLMRMIGCVGWQEDPLPVGLQNGKCVSGSAPSLGMENDFVLVGDGEDPLVKGPVY